MLPLFTVETFAQDRWHTFTETPFATREEAERHRKIMLEEYGMIWTDRDSVRVGEYTVEEWRADLIAAVTRDPDAVRRAMSILRNETLVDLLK